MKALVISDVDGNITVTHIAHSINETTEYSAQSFEVDMKSTDITHDTGTQYKLGAYITTTTKVLMYSFYLNNKITDGSSVGYMVYPTKFLGKKYIIPSFLTTWYNSQHYTDMRSVLTIAAIEPNTMVTITSKAGNKTIRLLQYQNVEISSGIDMSCSHVDSSKPIVVISGNFYRNLPTSWQAENRSPLLQMVLPTSQWDTIYVIPEIQTRTNNTVRIYSLNDGRKTNFALQLHNEHDFKAKTEATTTWYDFTHKNLIYI